MFAALLVVCSLNASNCTLIGTEAIYPTEVSCREAARDFVARHDEQIKRGLGPYVANLWCRSIPGQPA